VQKAKKSVAPKSLKKMVAQKHGKLKHGSLPIYAQKICVWVCDVCPDCILIEIYSFKFDVN
jgi:endonuclease III